MNAIVPINVAGLRVNNTDQSNVVNNFKGCTAVFDQMPYQNGYENVASTGDHIYLPLEGEGTAHNPLGQGVHLHWELPDFFRRGVQPSTGAELSFPHAPNRWLLTRYFCLYDGHRYSTVQTKSWIVESDFLSTQQTADAYKIMRPRVSVPLPANPDTGVQPYLYMGRVLDYDKWNPDSEAPADYLPAQTGADGKLLYLTAMGFTGPFFCAYYPECCSVFGFWDHFADLPVFDDIKNNRPIRFKVSYQLIGWINEAASDPLAGLNQVITDAYNAMLAQCQRQGLRPAQNPADVFDAYMRQHYRWTFNKEDISYTLDNNHNLSSLTVPGSFSRGSLQEIVWDLDENAVENGFLSNTDPNGKAYLWTDDQATVAVGNTTTEALSALVKKELNNTGNNSDLLNDFEYLLDAFQLGLLNGLENDPHPIFRLDEQLHARAFARFPGGQLWIVQQGPSGAGAPPDPDREITLPLDVAEQLHLLNTAQKNYDQRRARVLALRQQLFMDWHHYIRLYMREISADNVSVNDLIDFVSHELASVQTAGNDTGVLLYTQDKDTGRITGLGQEPANPASLAHAVWTSFHALHRVLPSGSRWTVQCVPSTPFWTPTDPVLLIEPKRIETLSRNAGIDTIFVRLSGELLGNLKLAYKDSVWNVAPASVAGLPALNPQQPLSADVQVLIGEHALLTPMLAGSVGSALQNQGGTGNPASGTGLAAFITALQSAQGGLSPADGGPGKGLFGAIREENYQPPPNPEQSSASAPLIAFTFSNAAGNGWPPDAVGWNAQQALPGLNSGKTVRLDPFLPTFLIWNAQLNPLVFNNTHSQQSNYDAANLTDYFQLDADAIDYQYKMNGSQAVHFASINAASMQNSVVLSKKPTYSLSAQIDNYVQNYPSDPANAKLQAVSEAYRQRKIMSQALSGFNLMQTLRNYIPQVPVHNLLYSPARDRVTANVHDAAGAIENDNWYDFRFNNMAAIAMGPQSFYNFGPLRSGFMSISYLEIVDVFGQRMQLLTKSTGPLQAIAALPLQPEAADTANAGKIFLPPRLLPPTRLWFRWLSAASNKGGDFEEMNTHPATTPVCGWVVPNHLDMSLMFYDADGKAIGSVGLRYGPQRYRTRPANIQANPSSDLSKDIGQPGNPTVNPNLANFIWYVYNQSADLQFLSDLLAAIETAGQFINPANHPQDAGLSVFIGRRLALTRAVLGLETSGNHPQADPRAMTGQEPSGNLLPLSQADVLPTDPFPSDVNHRRYSYKDRQEFSSGNLGAVQFPLRLGELTQTEDGLVAYLVESQGGYRNNTIYSPAASAPARHKVEQPAFDNILLTLNGQPFTLSLLVDPRAAVHATTGVLPVSNLRIPPDQYSAALQKLAMTFFTHPMLAPQQGLVTPLPRETGYDWSWIQPLGQAVQELPQKANAVNEYAIFGYTPQTLMEGWLQLKAAAKPSVADL